MNSLVSGFGDRCHDTAQTLTNLTSCLPLLQDDYLEMLVQFGYVTLFASAFPLASFIAVIANLVEYRADMWKMTRLVKRPCPSRLNSIGMW